MVKMLDSDIEILGFELLSGNYVHFRTDTLRKDIDSLIPSSCWGDRSTTIFLREWLWHKYSKKVDMSLKESNLKKLYICSLTKRYHFQKKKKFGI